jgi:hypothetical protein
MAAVKVKLPDFIDSWPWQRELNPHYEDAKRAANTWAHGFGFFDAKSQDAFDRCDFCTCLLRFYFAFLVETDCFPSSSSVGLNPD